MVLAPPANKHKPQEDSMAEFDLRQSARGAFPHALAIAKKGDVIIYHEGENMLGCPHKLHAMGAAEAGTAALVAKRLGPRHFLFMAQRTGVRK
jgi:hypothetical protein